MPDNSSGPEPGPRVPGAYRNGELVIVIDCADLSRAARFWSAAAPPRSPPSRSPRTDGAGTSSPTPTATSSACSSRPATAQRPLAWLARR
jgi:hypothetical protein